MAEGVRGKAYMLHLVVKAALSGVLIAAASELARRSPGFGALVTALPLVAILSMIWLWRDARDAEGLANYAEATFWYVLPSLPMFLLIPAMLRRGAPFWSALGAGSLLTIVLYLAMTAIAPKLGLKL